MTLFWLLTAAVAIALGLHLSTLLQLAKLRRTGLYPPPGQASMADVERLLKDGLPIFAIRCYREVHRCSLRQAKEAVRNLSGNS